MAPLWALWLALTPAAGAPALDEQPLLRARAAYDRLEYDVALVRLTEALRLANRRDDLIEIYELQGLSLAAVGRKAQAREAFARLLMIAPEHRLPEALSPRLIRAFEEARAAYSGDGWLQVAEKGVRQAVGPDPATVELRVENDPLGMASTVRLSYRAAGSATVRVREVPASTITRLRLDRPDELPADGGFIEYWCAVLDANGGELVTLASPEEPSRIAWVPLAAATPSATGPALPPPAPPSTAMALVTSPWFWTALGVVLVGAGAAVTYALLPDGPSYGDSMLRPKGGAL